MMNQLIDRHLVLLNVLFSTSIVIANVLAGKVVMIGSFVIPAAVVMYAFSFLFTDIIHENYGKEEAKRTVQYGFIAQIFASIMIYFGMLLPVAPFAADTQAAYEILLGQNYRFVLASLAAYLVSQHLDVYIFSELKKRTPIDTNGFAITLARSLLSLLIRLFLSRLHLPGRYLISG